MGLFNLGGSAEISNEKEAFFAIIFACMAADGEIAPEEEINLINEGYICRQKNNRCFFG